MVGNGQQTKQYHPKSTNKNVSPRKTNRSVGVVSPNETNVAIVENSMTKTETSQPVVKHAKSMKKTRFEDEFVCKENPKREENSCFFFSPILER